MRSPPSGHGAPPRPEAPPLLPPPSDLLWSPPPAQVELAPGEVHVFAFGLDLPAPSVRELERTLSPDERTRAGKLKLARDRARFVAGRALMRSILADHLGTDPLRVRFVYDANGKPGLSGGDAATGLRFNLSASHGLGLLAVRLDRDVGVDVERVRPFPQAMSVAERVFSREELAALRARPPEDRDAAFFSIWTRKEAVVKCLGSGLSFPTGSFTVAPRPTEGAECVLVETLRGPETLWVHSLPGPSERFVAALATAAASTTVSFFRWAPPSPGSADEAEPGTRA